MTIINKYIKRINEDNEEKNKKIILKKILLRLTGIIICIILWQIIGSFLLLILDPDKKFIGFLPYYTFKAFINLFLNKFFYISIMVSFFRISIGLLISALIGIPIGLIIGFYKTLKEISNIPIQFLRMISPLAWMPIALLILPGFEIPIIFLISIASIWPIIFNTNQGVANVNTEWIKMAKNQGAQEHQILFKVIFPASLPHILAGLRMAIGVAWIVLVPAELFGVTSGLGYLINDARDTFKYDNLMAIVLSIGLIGFIIDTVFHLIQKKIDWKD